MNTCFDYQLVDFRNYLCRFGIAAACYLNDLGKSMVLISRVDPFGRKADFEISPAFQLRKPFQDRNAILLGATDILLIHIQHNPLS